MKADLLFEDYKVKLDYVKSQYDRLWRRFDFFLSVELALFGFLGYLIFTAKRPDATALAALLGVGVSMLWYITGAQDRRLVEVYRERANDAAVRFEKDPEGLANYAVDHAGAEVPNGWRNVRSWYWSGLSITRLPATFALIFALVWLGVLVWGRALAQRLVE